jgi:two-component system, chemotaxis family, chemotaxis protein CheY
MNTTLLVTDDSMIIREMIKDVARGAGWTIAAEAANGLEAVQQYQLHRPTAVTLDLTMPDFDGIYALRHIREFDSQAEILVVSAIDQAPVIREAICLGASDFIVKPFDQSNLRKALELIAQRQVAAQQAKPCSSPK